MDTAASSSLPADDALLLRCYAREGSEAAFRALAERHLPLVWSVARRVVNGDAAMAEDIAQMVLADFARKAPSLPAGTVAAAWLHRHTVFTASKAVRSEVRRRAREQISAANETQTADAMNVPPDTWADVAPHIDSALDRLPAADRSAVLLRYYEQRPLREVSRAIGISEEAARKRIDRALTKLRSHLKRRGVVPAAAIIAAMLREQATAAPSAAVAQRMVSGAWNRVEAGAFTGAASTLIPWWRRRSALAVAAVVFTAGLIWMIMSGDAGARARGSNGVLRKASATGPATSHPAANSLSVTLTATLITLPEKSVDARMLRFEQGRDDNLLYRELLPQAEALQKLINPGTMHASAGMPLVVLSGEAKLKPLEERPSPSKPKKPPAPKDTALEPADPFSGPMEESQEADPFAPSRTTPTGPPSLNVTRAKDLLYPTEWPFEPASGLVTASDYTGRFVGTSFDANVYPCGPGSLYLIECSIDHMLEPEYEEWPYRSPQAPEAEEKRKQSSKIRQPRFRDINLEATLAMPMAGEPVLAAMTTVTPDPSGEGAQVPQRTFLFLTLQP